MMSLYIDPGTGSMIFSIVTGVVAVAYFMLKSIWIKIKFLIVRGRVSRQDTMARSIVIYSEGSRYWGVFQPVLAELEKRKELVYFYTSSQDDPFFQEGFEYVKGEYIGEGNKAFARLNRLEADVCLMTTPGLDVYQLKRSKGVGHYAHILHAPTDATGYRLFGLDYFDSVLLSGEYQKYHIRELEKKRNLEEKDLVVVGCPYLDVMESKISSLKENEEDDFTVLVAPSWGNNGILSKYGKQLLDPLVDTGFHIIVRPHPQSRISERDILTTLMKRYQEQPKLEWDFSLENLESLNKADIMISDFSGVMFDFCFLFDRPFMYVNSDFDARPYDSWDTDEKPWKFRILPEIGIELREEEFCNLEQVLINATCNESLQSNRRRAKDETWQYRGKSGDRTCDFLLAKRDELLKERSEYEQLR